MAHRALTLHDHHRRWAMWTSLLVFVAAGAAILIGLARGGDIDREPWGYIAVAAAILSAVTGLLLAFAQAAFESQGHHN